MSTPQKAAYDALRYQNNKETIKAYKAEYRRKNKDKIRANKTKYAQENKEAIAHYYQENKEAIAQYYQENKADIRAQQAIYYQENKDSIKVRKDEYYQANKDVHGVQMAKYREENRDAILRHQLWQEYELSLEDYRAMEVRQNGLCKICGGPPKGKRQRLSVDHCHITGKIRGLLCNKCNTGIGMLGDDLRILKRAMTYLEEALCLFS